MSIESSSNWPAAEPPPFVPAPRRRWPLALFMAVLVALAGAGGAYAWLNPGLFAHFVDREAPEADIASGDKALLTDLLASQQKTTDDLTAMSQAVADQQEQLKAVVSQLAALNAKIDAMRGMAPQAAAAPTFPMPGPAVAAPPAPTASTMSAPAAPAARAAAPKQAKRPPRPAATAGPISVGGAPLNAAATVPPPPR